MATTVTKEIAEKIEGKVIDLKAQVISKDPLATINGSIDDITLLLKDFSDVYQMELNET